MRRRIELLDQQLGDFAPLQQRLNQLWLERILARNVLTLLPDYQQILQENRDQMQLPGWWYRGRRQEYEGSWVQTWRHHGGSPEKNLGRANCGVSVYSRWVSDRPYCPYHRTMYSTGGIRNDISCQRPYAARRGYTRSSARTYR